MSVVHALVLGLVQGVTQFLPLSASGHNVLVPYTLGWPAPTAAFDVAAHAGALLGLIYVFRERITEIVRGGASGEPNRGLLRLIGLATVPITVAAAVASGYIERSLQRPVLTSLLLGVTGWALVSGERHAQTLEEDAAENALRRAAAERIGEDPPAPVVLKEERALDAADATTIGTAQAFSVLPGISRTGAAVSMGVRRGLSRESAARFSFLLAIPAIVVALAVRLTDLSNPAERAGGAGVLIGAAIASAIASVFAIRFFLRLVQSRGLRPFGVYCFLAMTAGLLTALARG